MNKAIPVVIAVLVLGLSAASVAAAGTQTSSHLKAVNHTSSTAVADPAGSQTGDQGQTGEVETADQAGDQGQTGEIDTADQTGDQGQTGEVDTTGQSGEQGQMGEVDQTTTTAPATK